MGAHQKYKLTKYTAMPWAMQYESAKNYIQRINGHKEDTALNLFHFCNWANHTPDTLLTLKSNPSILEAEHLLDRFVYSQVDLPDSTKWRVVQVVRGFFHKNYCMLQSEAGKMEYISKKSQGFPSKKQRCELYSACYNPRDRFLVLLSCGTALALETLHLLRWNHFDDDWMSTHMDLPHVSVPGNLVKGHGCGKYRGVRQETFLTPETKQCAIEYRNWFTQNFCYVWKRDDFVFLSVKDNVAEPLSVNGLSRVISDVSKRAKVRFSIHDGRRIVQTALESVGTSPQWIRKIKGRKVSGEESPYSKPCIEQLRGKFREALPELEFLGSAFRSGEEGLTDEEIKIAKTIIEQVKLGHLKYVP